MESRSIPSHVGDIRVLHLVGAMNRGGAETLLMEIYRNIDRDKVQFDFLTYNYSGAPGAYDAEIESLGGKIYVQEVPFYRGPISYITETKKLFDLHPEYRVVHAHQYAMSGYLLAAAKASSANRVTIAHSHIAHPRTDAVRRVADGVGKLLLRNNSDFFFGCSEDALVSLCGKRADEMTRFLVKNAIVPTKFSYSNEYRTKWRCALGADDETIVVGNVARFTNQKNHEHIIRTFAEIETVSTNTTLVLVGVGGKEQEIKAMAETVGIGGKVHFLGSRPDVNEIINAFDVFLMPSRYEGLGIVLIEAQANGLPCVISADVIPDEADVGAGLVTRVSLSEGPRIWASACLDAVGRRIGNIEAQRAVRFAGYDIKKVAAWLQNFYIERWSNT